MYLAKQAYPFLPFGFHLLPHGLCNIDTFTVVPLLASVATNHKSVVVGLVTDTPQFVGIIF